MNCLKSCSRSRVRRQRIGVSLIETLAVITLSSTLLVIAVGWIHQSFKLASISRDHQRTQQTLMRLSTQFRDDAHSAVAAESSEPNQIRLETGDKTLVRYEYESEALIRTEFEGDSIRSSERFHLGPRFETKLSVLKPSHVVSVEIIRKPRAGQDASQMIHELIVKSDFGRLDRITKGGKR